VLDGVDAEYEFLLSEKFTAIDVSLRIDNRSSVGLRGKLEESPNSEDVEGSATEHNISCKHSIQLIKPISLAFGRAKMVRIAIFLLQFLRLSPAGWQ
jgi:hypothetical protein